MPATVKKALFNFRLKVTETPTLAIPTVINPDIIHEIAAAYADVDDKEVEDFWDQNTVPSITLVWGDLVSLSGGAVTLDLTSLDQGNLSPNVDLTGLKVRLIKIAGGKNNSAKLVFKKGVTNGYPLFGEEGADSGMLVMNKDEVDMKLFRDSLPDVASGAKTIDVTSTDLDANFEIIIAAGPI